MPKAASNLLRASKRSLSANPTDIAASNSPIKSKKVKAKPSESHAAQTESLKFVEWQEDWKTSNVPFVKDMDVAPFYSQRRLWRNPEKPVFEDSLESLKSRKWVGVHVSAANGLFNSVHNALDLGACSFALFLKSQRQWNASPLTESVVQDFRLACKVHGFSWHHILPHGSYLVNLAHPKESEMREKSLRAFIEDVQRADRLGIRYYNFHPGSACGHAEHGANSPKKKKASTVLSEETRQLALALIADAMNEALSVTKNVILLVENMAGQGNCLGGPFSDLATLIRSSQFPSRVGVCLDTCHMFAYGYDLRTVEQCRNSFDDFDKQVGRQYLKAIHVNDSMEPFGSHRDRHANLGRGETGTAIFWFLMNDDRFNEMPLVLETPVWKDEILGYRTEIEWMYSLVGKPEPTPDHPIKGPMWPK